MSTKRELIRECIKEYAANNLIFGRDYSLRPEYLKHELERYVMLNAPIDKIGTISVCGGI